MSLLGDFLESFYGSRHEFHSVHARVRHEMQRVPDGAASRRHAIGKAKPSAAKTEIVTEDLVFWAVLPDNVRVDKTRTREGQPEKTVEVIRGSDLLKRNPDGSVEVERDRKRILREGDLYPTDYRRHFDRSLIREFFKSLTLDQIGECQIAGRNCVRIRALPVSNDGLWPHWLPVEADAFELAGDIALPSLLSIKGMMSDKTIASYEVVEVQFDESIDETVFDCEPTAGQVLREALPVVEQISLKAAASRVPFPFLLPPEEFLQENGCSDIMYNSARGDSDAYITVFFNGINSNSLWFDLRGQPDVEIEESLEWEEVEVSARTFKLSDPNTEAGLSVLAFKHDGTHVYVFSDMQRSELFDFALSLKTVEA